jgi:hypothetical protein
VCHLGSHTILLVVYSNLWEDYCTTWETTLQRYKVSLDIGMLRILGYPKGEFFHYTNLGLSILVKYFPCSCGFLLHFARRNPHTAWWGECLSSILLF